MTKSGSNDIISSYYTYLQLEKGLSPNSIDAYKKDFQKLNRFLDAEKITYTAVTYNILQQFVAQLNDLGIHPRSQARTISGIRSFFHFALLDGYIQSDPTELLETPKIGLKLPEILSIDEINQIIHSVDLSLPDGHRNRAMIEVLYSCGLRVSELVGLRCSDIYADEGFIRVEGKGSKQRLVPISTVALNEISRNLLSRENVVIKKGYEDSLFLSRRGTSLSRLMVFLIIKKQVQQVGIKKNVSPHTFRHSFATHLYEGGANLRAIQLMLGHEKITTTEIYTHMDRSFLRSEILSFHPRSKRKKD